MFINVCNVYWELTRHMRESVGYDENLEGWQSKIL